MKTSQIKPAPGYLLIWPETMEKVTSSGIYLPDNMKEHKPIKGTVMAVGDDVKENNRTLVSPTTVGDVVFYKKWAGNDVKSEDKELVIVPFLDVLAVVK